VALCDKDSYSGRFDNSKPGRHPDGTRTALVRHDPDEVIKVVGVLQALDGNMMAQAEELQSRADTWGSQIRDG
jgi:hypothetical protein